MTQAEPKSTLKRIDVKLLNDDARAFELFYFIHWNTNERVGVKSILKRKFVVKTIQNIVFQYSKYVLNRNFNSLKLEEKCVSDITYIRVNIDLYYLKTALDLVDRKIVGWSLSQYMTT